MKKESAEEYVANYLTGEILNGHLKPHTYLTPERALAKALNYSRPVIHRAIMRLENQGLVTIIPRQGVLINAYQDEGKLALIEHIIDHDRKHIDNQLNQSMLWFIHDNLKSILKRHVVSQEVPYEVITFSKMDSPERVFEWIKRTAIETQNVIYPMLINEFKIGILNVSEYLLTSQPAIDALNQVVIEHYINDDKALSSKMNLLFETIEAVWMGDTTM